jgi:hypothetical protein
MLVCDLCLLYPAVLVVSGLSEVLGALGQILLSYLVHMHSRLRSLRQGHVHVGPITWEVLPQYLNHREATCLVRRPDNDLRGARAFSEHYSITERDTAEATMQDAARRALSQYCSLFSGVVDGLDLKYYPHRSTSSAGGVIVSPVGEGNHRLNNMVNLAAVHNTELDHALDELGKVRAEVAELRAECAAHHYLDGGSPAPIGIQHPYHSPPRGRFDYGTPDCRTRIDLDP